MGKETVDMHAALKKQQEEARKAQKDGYEKDSYADLLNVLNTRLLSVECKAKILAYGIMRKPCLAFTKGDEDYVEHGCSFVEVPPDCLVNESI